MRATVTVIPASDYYEIRNDRNERVYIGFEWSDVLTEFQKYVRGGITTMKLYRIVMGVEHELQCTVISE